MAPTSIYLGARQASQNVDRVFVRQLLATLNERVFYSCNSSYWKIRRTSKQSLLKLSFFLFILFLHPSFPPGLSDIVLKIPFCIFFFLQSKEEGIVFSSAFYSSHFVVALTIPSRNSKGVCRLKTVGGSWFKTSPVLKSGRKLTLSDLPVLPANSVLLSSDNMKFLLCETHIFQAYFFPPYN